MERFAEEGKAVGIILDVSLRHEIEGLRLIDGIKKELVKIVKNGFENDLDILYLYHPEVIDPVRKHGEQFYVVGSYETDGWLFNMTFALKQTLYALAMEDLDLRKYLVLITDRITDKQPLEKILFINKKDRIDAFVILIGIGEYYDKSLLSSLVQEQVVYLHLHHHSEIYNSLLKESHNGPKDICRQTFE